MVKVMIFYLGHRKASAVFWSAVITQLTIFYIYYLDVVSFL
ncbi:hypothetical protein FLJC2902T_26410 [Flavobacterium limnosediminis JC2902]|uniref:Uncharacterized protein n=1 Tax=Flavobacterium limnosediminis JC2902 TaxID=1341181 RepID=V6SJD6_9FLAO|nr:hypothetical protein FLJC2902T_26410 [Flavobacterium limnosediminis JC2902]